MEKDLNNKKLNIDINNTKPFKCPECGNDIFMLVYKFRTVSKLLAGTPEDQMIPLQTFVCTKCGLIPPEFEDEPFKK